VLAAIGAAMWLFVDPTRALVAKEPVAIPIEKVPA